MPGVLTSRSDTTRRWAACCPVLLVAAVIQVSRRPRERGDPYAESLRFGTVVDIFASTKARGYGSPRLMRNCVSGGDDDGFVSWPIKTRPSADSHWYKTPSDCPWLWRRGRHIRPSD